MQKTIYGILVVLVAAATVGVMLLIQNIASRKREAQQVSYRVVNLDETTVAPEVWAKNFPRQYDTYRRTVDMVRTRYGGSEALPEQHLTTSKIEADPRLKTMWAGYAFAVDFREERGHAYMLIDQRETERVKQFKQPGACLHCHASVINAYRQVGREQGAPGNATDPLLSEAGRQQLMAGFEKVCGMPYAEAHTLVEHPVACLDCHDPNTLALRVTRPGFLNGIAALARADDPVAHLSSIERWRQGPRQKPYDPNTDSTRQEMRSFVCGQCHVEYYFQADSKLVTYPWHKGLKAEQIEAYYDQPQFKDQGGQTGRFSDWQHKTTAAKLLKAQHPEFEVWSQGIHARSGVSCADCHMPYLREGAVKVSSHHVRSPLLTIAASCQVCHRYSEGELQARIETIQDRTKALMDRSLDALMALIADLAEAQKSSVPPERLDAVQYLQRRAQWRIDYINAENSMGFHAPQEAARLLGEAIDMARQGQLALRQTAPSPTPSTTP